MVAPVLLQIHFPDRIVRDGVVDTHHRGVRRCEDRESVAAVIPKLAAFAIEGLPIRPPLLCTWGRIETTSS